MMILCCKSRCFFSGFCLFFLLFCFFICAPRILSADVATDGTVGPALSLSGPDYQIPQDLGTISGQNLFHSFHDFSLAQGEIATFTGSDSIANVISRVTGGEVSSIDGILRSQVGQADFFFINPAGVMFGPNAEVDVPGAFHVTTADELRFADGNVFSSLNPHASTLTMAEPSSFGFLSSQSASIVLNGARLEFVPESTVTISGGDVGVSFMGKIQAEGGSIRVVGVGEGANQMEISDASTVNPPLGDVVFDFLSCVDVSGFGGSESVLLRGNQIKIIDSEVAADHSGVEDSSGKSFLQGEDVCITNGDVHANVFSDGDGNNIVVEARELKIDAATAPTGRSRLTTRVKDGGVGKAGDINIFVDNVSLQNGGQISSISEGLALGDGGTIHIHASDDVSIQGLNGLGIYSGVFSATVSDLGSDGGNIIIDAPDGLLMLSDGGSLQTGTIGTGNSGTVSINVQNLTLLNESAIDAFTQGPGKGGYISIMAKGSINLDNAEIDASTRDTGHAGTLFFSGNSLNLFNGSKIMADAYDSGNAGNIQVNIGGIVFLDQASLIEAGSIGAGAAGQVELNANTLSLLGGSRIYAGSQDYGSGGRVAIDVDGTFLMADFSLVSCGIENSVAGPASNVLINASTLDILNGSLIDNITNGDGNGGNIVVSAGDLTIDGKGAMTGIMGGAESGLGNGADIDINVLNRLELLNGGQIASNTRDKGEAGKVTIETAELFIHGGGYEQSQFTGIFSDSRLASGNGGVIDLRIKERVEILNSGQISAGSFDGAGDGGSVTVTASELVINGEEQNLQTGILARSINSSGNGGDVKVFVIDRLELLNGGQISSDVGLGPGDAGNVTVEASELLIDGQSSSIVFEELEFEFSGAASGIFSTTQGSFSGDISGNSGNVRVMVTDHLDMNHGGQISTSSNLNGGDAGSVTVETSELTIRGQNAGIFSQAIWGALGQVGDISIIGESICIEELGEISISAGQTLSKEIASNKHDARIQVDSNLLHLDKDARITAESTGNVPAAAIELNVSELVVENGSSITTSAQEADGGPITIHGNTMLLRDGLITTSVAGDSGDGGTIFLTGPGMEPANVIVFDGGFVQANTSAQDAHGGDIILNARVVIAEEDELFVGGDERHIFEPGQGLNVIQAAAPGGEQGTINITAPELDISGFLVQMAAGFIQPARLATDQCSLAAGQGKSSLILEGRGGIPADPGEPLDISLGQERLDRLVKTDREKKEKGNMINRSADPLEKSPGKSR